MPYFNRKEYLKNSHEEYDRIVKWIQQLNAQYENKEVTHSQLLDEAKEIGVAVVGLCSEKKWIKLLAK